MQMRGSVASDSPVGLSNTPSRKPSPATSSQCNCNFLHSIYRGIRQHPLGPPDCNLHCTPLPLFHPKEPSRQPSLCNPVEYHKRHNIECEAVTLTAERYARRPYQSHQTRYLSFALQPARPHPRSPWARQFLLAFGHYYEKERVRCNASRRSRGLYGFSTNSIPRKALSVFRRALAPWPVATTIGSSG
jgi:hypothetical protein